MEESDSQKRIKYRDNFVGETPIDGKVVALIKKYGSEDISNKLVSRYKSEKNINFNFFKYLLQTN